QFKTKDNNKRKQVYDFYLSQTHNINNWDLVDLSCYFIVGQWLLDKDRAPLYQLAESTNLWEQRISIVSTMAFVRNYDFADTLKLTEKLINHEHDLIHKACGWLLREVGKRDEAVLTNFLDTYSKQMPRTMLRYSIEKLTKEQRTHYMIK
ncbi:MAG: DNA alkylation repair protein, partial [Proteiniphilum sp.]|nr:DNA alkylation repair protein [Proteiniphilum sp.]